MTEKELRDKVAQKALSYVGVKEYDESGYTERYKSIVDTFNRYTHLGLAYGAPWCAAFVTVISGLCGIQDAVPQTASCNTMIAGFQRLGSWVENDAYIPDVGDFVFFIWDVTDVKDNQEEAEHVGIVVNVSGTQITVVDGNNSKDEVGKRYISVNSINVRGYGTPKYDAIARGEQILEEPYYEETVSVPVIGKAYSGTEWEEWMSTERELWLRRYKLQVGFQGKPGGFEIGEYSDPSQPPLRVQFSVEKCDMKTQNNSTLKIWNLGKSKRALISTPGCYVVLYAGYGDKLPHVTEGVVIKAIDSLDSGDLVTEVEILDLRLAIRDTFVSLSYQGQVDGRKIINDVIAQMGIDAPVIPDDVVFRTYNRGFAFIGTGLKALEKVSKDSGVLCTVLNGDITIHKKGTPLNKNAVILSAETGLIGIPQRMVEVTDGTYYLKGYQVEFMMNCSIDLNSYVRLVSEFVENGQCDCTVVKLSVEGDSAGGEWKCSAELQDTTYGDMGKVIYEPSFEVTQ